MIFLKIGLFFTVKNLAVVRRCINTHIRIHFRLRNPRQVYQYTVRDIKTGIGCSGRYKTNIMPLFSNESLQQRPF